MHKVIVEEPRHGGHWSKKNRRGNLSHDQLPKHEGMRRPHTNRKWFGEHLGPLKRWLRSNNGRLWNDVFSEACRVIKPDNVVRLHIRTHMLQYVERNTFMCKGEVWCFQHSGAVPVRTLRGHTVWPKFYVHPETGILHEVPHSRPSSEHREGRQAARDAVRKWISEHLLLIKVQGLWYACEMASYRDACSVPPFDLLIRLRLSESHAAELYGKALYCVRKRQLSRAQLEKYDLKNSLDPHGIETLLVADLMGRIKCAIATRSGTAFRAEILF
jgi:hypothetical protein